MHTYIIIYIYIYVHVACDNSFARIHVLATDVVSISLIGCFEQEVFA